MSRAAIAERATHAGERAKEMLDKSPSTVVSRARSLVSGDAQFFSAQPKLDQMRKQLESDSIQEKKDAMKRVIAQICKGNDMSPLFPDVVKNILIQSIELRKLIYYFIVHYAEDRPNESLLSISAFQKDLVDTSMHVRALALRMLSSIRIPAINPVVMVAVKKCATDMSPIVRKTAAIALAQVHAISGEDADNVDILVDMLRGFLGDRSPDVAAAAALSFVEICPDRMDLLHANFRKLCRTLVECDEWGQVVLMHVLTRYARTQFLDPNRKPEDKKKAAAAAEGEGAGSDDDDDTSSDDSSNDRRVRGKEELAHDLRVDADHRLLLTAVKPLLLSVNRAVVVAASSLYFHIAPTEELDICVKPLLRLLGGPAEGHSIVLSAIHTLVLSRPQPFVPYVKDFFVNSDDTADVRELKLRIISKLATASNFTAVIHEFRSYLRSFDVKKVIQALQGLALISSAIADSSTHIMRLITPLLSHRHSDVVTESVVVLRQLVVQGTDKAQTCRIVHRLLQQVMKGEISSATARSSIVWLVGENIHAHPVIATAAPDCFRTFAKKFATEDPQVKKQVLTLGMKIWLQLEGEGRMADRFKQLFFYVLELVRYDADYEVRDRGRVVECTIDRTSPAFASLKSAVLAPKPVPQQNDPFLEKAKFQLGSLSHLCGNALLGYKELPPWPLEQPNPAVRDPPSAAGRGGANANSDSDHTDYSDDDDDATETTTTEDDDDDSDDSPKSSSASGSGASSDASDDDDSDASSSAASSTNSSSSGAAAPAKHKTAPAAKGGKHAAKAAPAPVPVKKVVVISRVVPGSKPAAAAAAAPAAAAVAEETPAPAPPAAPQHNDDDAAENGEPAAAEPAAAAAGASDTEHEEAPAAEGDEAAKKSGDEEEE